MSDPNPPLDPHPDLPAGAPDADELALELTLDKPAAAGADAAAVEQTPPTDMPINLLVREINAGRISARDLPAEVRQNCVAHLTDEGFSAIEIANLMRLCERTIFRDRVAARKLFAVEPSLRLGDELLGQFERHAHAAIQRLTRIARDPETTPFARVWAEEAAIRIHQRVFDTASRMNYFEDGQRRLRWQVEDDPAIEARQESQHRKSLKQTMNYSSFLTDVEAEARAERLAKHKKKA